MNWIRWRLDGQEHSSLMIRVLCPRNLIGQLCMLLSSHRMMLVLRSILHNLFLSRMA